MIRYLPHNEIDKFNWDNTISFAQNSRIYAFSWYLDIVSPGWDALVMNDYESIMPLTWKKKYGIYYLVQPLFTQQLGIFGKNNSKSITDQFIANLPRKYKKFYIKLNESNFSKEFHHLLTCNTNFILDLSDKYECIYNNFSKGLKNHLKNSLMAGFNIETSIDFETLANFLYINLLYKIDVNKTEAIRILKSLYAEFIEKSAIRIYSAYINNSLSSIVILINSNNRWTLLISASDHVGRTYNGKSFILNNFIQDRAGKPEILDFEGSNLPNIAKFNSSFGAIQKTYYSLNAINPNLYRFKNFIPSI